MVCPLPGIFCSDSSINPEFHLSSVWENEIKLFLTFYVDRPAVLNAVVLRKLKQVLSSSLKQVLVIMTHSEDELDPSVLFVQFTGLIY
jgi:hypothetical protein